MLSFVTYKEAPEQIEIIGDAKGLSELVNYINNVLERKDHFHLMIDSEIDPYPIPYDRQEIVHYVKHVRIEFLSNED